MAPDSSALEIAELLVECEVNLPAFASTQQATCRTSLEGGAQEQLRQR